MLRALRFDVLRPGTVLRTTSCRAHVLSSGQDSKCGVFGQGTYFVKHALITPKIFALYFYSLTDKFTVNISAYFLIYDFLFILYYVVL